MQDASVSRAEWKAANPYPAYQQPKNKRAMKKTRAKGQAKLDRKPKN